MIHKIKTASGEYSVYHCRDAGGPECFEADALESGPWFFEPGGYNGSDRYSDGHPTFAEAKTQAIEDGARVAAEDAMEAEEAAELAKSRTAYLQDD